MIDSHRSPADKFGASKRKLWRYILAVDSISRGLQTIENQALADEIDFEGLLTEVLPHVRMAFACKGAFYADRERRIRFVEPENDALVDKIFPITESTSKSLERGKPEVIIRDKDHYPELDALGAQSLLIASVDVPWGTYLVGVYDGRDDPAFIGEDKTFLRSLMDLWASGIRYGYKQRNRLVSERYQHAHRRGEYSLISRASEDYARFKLRLPGDTANVQDSYAISLDNLLADYLDAELCKIMQHFDSDSGGISDSNIATEGMGTLESPEDLLSLVKLSEEHQGFAVRLRESDVTTKSLESRWNPRTALAIARIGLWVGYVKAGMRVPEWLGEQEGRLDSLLRKGLKEDEVETADLFYTLPNWLLETVEAEGSALVDKAPTQQNIDWLRTLWQKIHYLARNGISEPRCEWIREVANIYAQIRSQTTCILWIYLNDHMSEEGLRIDSDWLIAWLVSNVLLSKHLAEYYSLEDMTDDSELISSPTEKMRYFAHISHLVLYILHCIHHLLREKKMKAHLKYEVEVRRLPFAEALMDLSLSLSESQLYILGEYAYREIGVHRELVLPERLAHQLRYELPLHTTSEFYRDHLYHVIDVCLLGELLLRGKLSSCAGDTFSQSVIDILSNSTDDAYLRLLMQNWYIAALCHDLGYVVERARSLLEPVRTIDGPGLDEFWKAVEDGLKSGDSAIREVIESKLSNPPDSTITINTINDLKEIVSTDHGVAAWLHLSHWLGQVKESSEKLAPALNAILRHNLPQQQVSISHEPLTLLLMLCDHLQEWGRPRVGPDPLARGVLEALRFSEQPEFDQKIRVRQLRIKGLRIVTADQGILVKRICRECLGTTMCKDHCPRIQTEVEHNSLEFELRHIESREADFEPAISWLLLCRDLQCFGDQDEELPFDIKVTLRHTPSRIWHVLPWKPLEMDLVQEFASEYQSATYLCEWAVKARRGEDGLYYTGNRDDGSESFTIHLNQLGRPLKRGLLDEHWQQFFKWKWRRLGQQFIGLRLGAWFPDF